MIRRGGGVVMEEWYLGAEGENGMKGRGSCYGRIIPRGRGIKWLWENGTTERVGGVVMACPWLVRS